ncbi:hypothetical protein [Leucobacter sp. gxy201]|uniref:hypothetical protein n=1 Tax=Leucobacter sp. gxy201 TaxID=2957200 RepID=UPI003DA06618
MRCAAAGFCELARHGCTAMFVDEYNPAALEARRTDTSVILGGTSEFAVEIHVIDNIDWGDEEQILVAKMARCASSAARRSARSACAPTGTAQVSPWRTRSRALVTTSAEHRNSA